MASILSLVSEKCDLKGRRIKRDKLFWTTVNKGELLKLSTRGEERRRAISSQVSGLSSRKISGLNEAHF